MSTLPSIRHQTRIIEGGLWHTSADAEIAAARQSDKTVLTGFSERNTLSDGCLKLFSGRNSGRRRRRSMARTYIALAFGLGLGACSQAEYRDAQSRVPPMSVKKPGPVAAPFIPCTKTPAGDPGHDRVWAACMTMHKPNRQPGYELETTIDNYMKP
jgi:hypothetical protein